MRTETWIRDKIRMNVRTITQKQNTRLNNRNSLIYTRIIRIFFKKYWENVRTERGVINEILQNITPQTAKHLAWNSWKHCKTQVNMRMRTKMRTRIQKQSRIVNNMNEWIDTRIIASYSGNNGKRWGQKLWLYTKFSRKSPQRPRNHRALHSWKHWKTRTKIIMRTKMRTIIQTQSTGWNNRNDTIYTRIIAYSSRNNRKM